MDRINWKSTPNNKPRRRAFGRDNGAAGSELGRTYHRTMWILMTVTEDLPEKTFRILPGNIRTIGRATGADFIVDAALISRVHCRLTALADGELEVRDLESTNGTFVNGERIETARLAPGDRLQVGRVELVALRETE